MELQHSFTVDRPVEKVWAFFQTPESEKAWQPAILEEVVLRDVPPDSPSRVGVGLTCREVRQFLGTRGVVTWEVNEYIPQRKIAVRSITAPIPYEGSYSFENIGEGTRFTYWIRTGKVAAAWRLLTPLINRAMRKQIRQDLGRLRAILEALP